MWLVKMVDGVSFMKTIDDAKLMRSFRDAEFVDDKKKRLQVDFNWQSQLKRKWVNKKRRIKLLIKMVKEAKSNQCIKIFLCLFR